VNVAVLFARRDSIYKRFPGCDVWDEERDARNYRGPKPVVAHPPCAQWGRMRGFAKQNPATRALAPLAVALVRAFGGVLEHPYGSALWSECGLPAPGARDSWGGFTLGLSQRWFGHPCEKRTLLYICGVEPRAVPTMPMSFALPTHVVTSYPRGQRPPGLRLPSAHKKMREATPEPFARWLVEIASQASGPEHTGP
jgi:hypothetical protein